MTQLQLAPLVLVNLRQHVAVVTLQRRNVRRYHLKKNTTQSETMKNKPFNLTTPEQFLTVTAGETV